MTGPLTVTVLDTSEISQVTAESTLSKRITSANVHYFMQLRCTDQSGTVVTVVESKNYFRVFSDNVK